MKMIGKKKVKVREEDGGWKKGIQAMKRIGRRIGAVRRMRRWEKKGEGEVEKRGLRLSRPRRNINYVRHTALTVTTDTTITDTTTKGVAVRVHTCEGGEQQVSFCTLIFTSSNWDINKTYGGIINTFGKEKDKVNVRK